MAGCLAGPLDGFGVGFWSGGFWWIIGCLDPGAWSLFFFGIRLGVFGGVRGVDGK